jgi:hypothetical protein
MKVTKIEVGVDKKLSVNYQSLGLHIGMEAEVGEDESAELCAQELKKVIEGILDPMLIDSAKSLTDLAKQLK